MAAASNPTPREGDWTVRDFRFTSGKTLPELRLHYTTIGNPSGEPVLILHGTGSSGSTFLADSFAGEMFGPGQPLDATTHYIILPDGIGTGKSSKPSDGLKGAFPRYTYEDMVRAQYRLVTERLGVRHLRLIVGGSMGGMHAWMWSREPRAACVTASVTIGSMRDGTGHVRTDFSPQSVIGYQVVLGKGHDRANCGLILLIWTAINPPKI